MTDTFKYIYKRYRIDSKAVSPIKLPYGRNDLAILFKELNFKKGAEVGVELGRYAQVLCKANPGVKLYCIDSWEDYEEYLEKKNKDNHSKYHEITKRRLKVYNCEIVKKPSMNAVKDFARDSLDFVYIDGNHSYDYVLEDITEWSKIVRKKGIVAGHDYMDTKMMHLDVVKAVDLYVKENNKTLFLLTRQHGPESNTAHSSWFFVN